MVDLGYETHSTVINLGSISLFIWIYALRLVLFIFFKGSGQDYFKEKSKKM